MKMGEDQIETTTPDFRPGISDGVKTILGRLLDKKAQSRPTACELVTWLRDKVTP
jgi:hypothetical protein